MLKKSFTVLSNNTSLIFKLLIFFSVILLIAVSLFFSFINPVADEVIDEVDAIIDILQKPFEAEVDSFYGFFSYLSQVFKEIFEIFSENIGLMLKFILFCYVFGLVLRMLITVTSAPTALVLVEAMTKNHKISFFNSIILTFKKSIAYAFISSIIIFTIDFLLLIGTVFLIKTLATFMNDLFALALGLYLYLVLFCIRISLFAQWMPLMMEENMSVFKALKANFRIKNNFKNILPNIMIIIIMQFGITFTTLLPTLGLLPIFTFSICMILLEIIKLVAFLDKDGKKYSLNIEEI